MIKIIVTGGRDNCNKEHLYGVLDSYSPDKVIVGDARGVDQLALSWCADRNIPHKVYVAQWDAHGLSAGPIRNKMMLEDNLDSMCVLAFKGGRGTANCVKQAKQLGLKVVEV